MAEPPVLRPHEVEVRTTSIARLVVAEAEAHGIGPEAPQVDQIHEWAVRLPHDLRVARLYELGERTDDLWLRIRELLRAQLEAGPPPPQAVSQTSMSH
jgi:hypothetical protein